MPFQPGNKLAANRTVHPTQRFLSADLRRQLGQVDPKTGRTFFDLGNEEIARAYAAGEPWAVAYCAHRIEGRAVSIVEMNTRDLTPKPVEMIRRDMSPHQAMKLYQDLLRNGDDDDSHYPGDYSDATTIEAEPQQTNGHDDEPAGGTAAA